MEVGVLETRQDRPPLELDHAGGDEMPELGVRAHGGDPAFAHGDGLRVSAGDGVNAASS